MPSALAPALFVPAIQSPHLQQFARQVTDDIKVTLLDSLGPDRPRVGLDPIARVLRDHRVTSKAPLRDRLVARRSHLGTVALSDHARRYELLRTSAAQPLLASHTPLQLAAAYGWTHTISKATFEQEFRKLPSSVPTTPHLAAMLEAARHWAAEKKPQPYRSVTFRVWRVDCVHDTSEVGKDEIWMAGTAVDCAGIQSAVGAFKVKSFSGDGTHKDYAGGKSLYTFPIDAAAPFPQIDTFFLHLAETDHGGFGDFLNDFYDAVKGVVVSILVDAATTIGAQMGASLGSIGGPVGTVIGAIVGMVLGAVIGWLLSCLKDDIFEPQAAAIQIPSATDDFNGFDSSPVYSLTYKGFGGKYVVSYDWLLTR